jgi:hypothetical protein
MRATRFLRRRSISEGPKPHEDPRLEGCNGVVIPRSYVVRWSSRKWPFCLQEETEATEVLSSVGAVVSCSNLSCSNPGFISRGIGSRRI